MNDKVLGGLYGALVGDAVGVPYEFRAPVDIPPYDEIDMYPPVGYNRAWSNILPGTYSDDGAQMLCVADCLTQHKFSAVELHETLRNWLRHGYMSVDTMTFDVGNQTSSALRTDVGTVRSTLSEPQFNGNGSLMRTLPVAFEFHTPGDIILIAREMSCATHPHTYSQLCCALYCLIAHHLLVGWGLRDAIDISVNLLLERIPAHTDDIAYITSYEHMPHSGTGFVIDSLWSAISAVERSDSYEDAIKIAIQYGNDTDTTACIAGGLAGIMYGYGGIPQNWIDVLRDKEHIDSVIAPLLNVAT